MKGTEEFKVERKAIVIAEDDGKVVENSPQRPRDDVVREDYTENTAELPSRGQARLLTEKWAAPREEGPKELRPIRLVEGDVTEPSVVENEPAVRTDVIREDDSNEEARFSQILIFFVIVFK